MPKRATASGFTFFEFFVVVLIVAILVGVALPYFFSARDTEAEATIKANMKIAQMAAESYARDHGGTYPPSAVDLVYQSYFPGGNRDEKNPVPGNFPINPFTKHPEAPVPGNISDPQKARQMPPRRLGQPGAIYYNSIATAPPGGGEPAYTSYAIQGAGKSGYALIDREGGPVSNHVTIVLSRDLQ